MGKSPTEQTDWKINDNTPLYVDMSQVGVKVCNDKQSILLFKAINSFIFLGSTKKGGGEREIFNKGRFQNIWYIYEYVI